MIGDALIKSDKDTSSGAGHVPKASSRHEGSQAAAAMPLASFLRFDPWTDQVVQMHTSFEPILSERDKMPFEVTPVYMKLSYYAPPGSQAGCGAAAAPAPAAAAPADPNAPPAANAAAPPADTTAQQGAAPGGSAQQTAPATTRRNSRSLHPAPTPRPRWKTRIILL